jgi:hypothetical protein
METYLGLLIDVHRQTTTLLVDLVDLIFVDLVDLVFVFVDLIDLIDLVVLNLVDLDLDLVVIVFGIVVLGIHVLGIVVLVALLSLCLGLGWGRCNKQPDPWHPSGRSLRQG